MSRAHHQQDSPAPSTKPLPQAEHLELKSYLVKEVWSG